MKSPNQNRPFFSIVIPTRNRAKLLPYAVQSVINQTDPDFELIISDNSSSDDTPQIARRFADDRVRYFRTEKSLPIDESWEFALSHARGEYVTFLSDDDAYAPIRLKAAKDVIDKYNSKLVVHKYCFFYPNGYQKAANPNGELLHQHPPNEVVVPWFSGETVEIEAKKTLSDMYSTLEYNLPRLPPPIYHGYTPHMSDAFYRRSLFAALRKRLPRLMKSHRSDFYLGVLTMNEAVTYHYVDRPLTLLSIHEESASKQIHQRALANQLDTFTEDTSFKKVPFKAWTERNSYADILLEAKDDDPQLSQRVTLNWENYYAKCYEDLMIMKELGSDISQHLESFERVLCQESLELQTKVRAKMQVDGSQTSSSNHRLRTMLQRAVFSSSLLLRGAMLLAPHHRFGRKLIMCGEKSDFSSIVECAAMFDEHFLDELVRFWRGNGMSIPGNGRLG